MLKQINWKAVLLGFTWLICLSGLIMLMSFIEGKKRETSCTKLKISLLGTEKYIERSEVIRIMSKSNGKLIGKNINELAVQRIENTLKANPFIEQAKIYLDMDGKIWVQIKQREPVLRVINSFNQDFYIDRNGQKMPISKIHTPHILVASGTIMETFSGKIDTLKTPLAKDLFKVAQFIESDPLWNEQIEQVYVNQNIDLELVPRVGDHKIIIGNSDSLQTKFNNLLLFYKKALPKVGWNTYKTINLKYAGQIVCERAVIDSTKNNLASPLNLSQTKHISEDIVNKLKR